MAHRKGTLPLETALELSVGDVMIARPKTLPSDATVADARALFERRGVRTVLLVDGSEFRGAIDGVALPDAAGDGEAALSYADPTPVTALPTLPMAEALALLEGLREPRLVVLDEDGVTLRGLLCANGDATSFCVR